MLFEVRDTGYCRIFRFSPFTAQNPRRRLRPVAHTIEPSLLLDLPPLLMDQSIVSEQAAQAGDVQTVEPTGQSFAVIPQEEGAADEIVADSDKDGTPSNKDKKDWRKSDKEWQEMKEKADKGATANEILSTLTEALGIKKKDDEEGDEVKEKLDPLKAVTQEVENLKQQLEIAKWERDHPAVTTAEYREAWQQIVKDKGHLVKSGDLSYDELWAIIRKTPKPSNSSREFKEQSLNIGSVPSASKTVVSGQEIDPDIYAAMKRKGWSDEQIRLSA